MWLFPPNIIEGGKTILSATLHKAARRSKGRASQRERRTLTIAATTLLGLFRMTQQIVKDVTLTKSLQQHVASPGIDRDNTPRVEAEVVFGELLQVPVFELASQVAFV